MDSDHSVALPAAAHNAPPKSDEAYQVTEPPSPITSDEVGDSSFEEGDSGESGDSGFHTGSDAATDPSAPLDRVTAASEIITVLNRYPEISAQLIEWARIFIEEEPEMLTRSSTIVAAHPDRERAYAEFDRGVSAICRIVTDQRLMELRGWAFQLEEEWKEAAASGEEEPQYSDFIDLTYTEAEYIVEKGEGQYRDAGDVEIVGEVFGFAREEASVPNDGGEGGA